MRSRVLVALAALTAAFVLAGLFAYERFYLEMNLILGLVVLTPALGVGLGAVLGFLLSGGRWKQGLSILLVCVLAALPAFGISRVVGRQFYRLRLERRNQEALREPERKLRELAAAQGWTLQTYDLTSSPALVVYTVSGQTRLAAVAIDERAVPIGDIALKDVEQELAREFGAQVELKPVDLFNARFLAVVNAKEVVIEIRPDQQESVWRVRCDQAACPTPTGLVLPLMKGSGG